MGQPPTKLFIAPPDCLKSLDESRKVCTHYRGDYEFSILTVGTFTFKTVSPLVLLRRSAKRGGFVVLAKDSQWLIVKEGGTEREARRVCRGNLLEGIPKTKTGKNPWRISDWILGICLNILLPLMVGRIYV